MPPKGKGKEGTAPPGLPRIGERVTNKLIPVFDAAAVKASFDQDAKSKAGEPYLDVDFDGVLPMPTALEAEVSTWVRPKELGEAEPYVLEPTIDPDNPRVLANGLDTSSSHREGTRELLDWLSSSILLVAEHAPFVAEGNYLWQLIHPQNEQGVPRYNERGRYVVRLFDHGEWRAVTIDDRLPLDANKRPLFPRSKSPLELWPMLLCKAVIKLASRTVSGLNRNDPMVVTAITGWLPQVVPIDPARQPEHLVWEELIRALADRGAMAGLVAASDNSDPDAFGEVEAAGLRTGPLVMALEFRATHDRGNMARLKSDLLEWKGPFADTDEERWTKVLDEELGWHRRQRLRKVAAGAFLPDFWTSEASLNSFFGSLYIWRDPAEWTHSAKLSGITHVPGHQDALLSLRGASDLLVALTVSPAGGTAEAPCWVRLDRHDFDETRAAPAKLHLDASRTASVVVRASPGAYHLSCHSATELTDFPAFFHWTVVVCASVPLALGTPLAVAADEGGRKTGVLATSEYNAMEANLWALPVRARVAFKGDPGDWADETGRVPATLRFEPHDDKAARHLCVHFVDNDTGQEVSLAALHGSGLRVRPGQQAAYAVLVETKAPVDLNRDAFTLELRSPVDTEITLEPVMPLVTTLGAYVPSFAHTASGKHVLFRIVAAGASRSTAALRLELGDPDAEVTVRVWRYSKEAPDGVVFKTKQGRGVCVVASVPVEVGDGGKGAVAGARTVVEAELSRATVERLKLLRPPRGAAPHPEHPLDPALQAADEEALLAAAAAGGSNLAVPSKGGARRQSTAVTGDKGDKRRMSKAQPGPPPEAAEPLAAAPGKLAYKLMALSDVAVTLEADDSREKELAAMKAAWEQGEAGRFARGMASRAKFLVHAGALSEASAQALVATLPAPTAAKGGGGGAKGDGRKSKPNSRAQTPGGTANERSALWHAPIIKPAGGEPELLGPEGRTERQAAISAAEAAEAERRQALFDARGGHHGPRGEAIAAIASERARARESLAASNAAFQETWKQLCAERKGPEDNPPEPPKKGKSKK